MPSRSRLLRLEPAARKLGVPAAWLRREINEGRLPALRAGTSLLVDVALVERALLERARLSPDSPEEGER